ncbi:hypothetical protein HID58_042512 [Brassica napus]|uniref:Uncharacterized protein n=1 Tax=Brassica napus TaxID=3708 RepID=A0ABQ8BDY3_BRANA|nr:hypothetical protein HID58_042512 [Brassica napus]
MVKNKHNKKPTTLLRLVSTLVGCVFMIHLIMLYRRNYSVDTLEVSSQLLIHHPIVRELERVEEANIHMPPPRKRSPRAIKRPTTLVEEFLDENSQIRHLFFPDMKSSYGPTKDGGNDTLHRFFPGKIWLETEGNPIQAHGGGMLYDEKSKSYYWYAEETDETHDLHKLNVLERPKVIYNSDTGKYVMWMHVDDANYTKASVGVAISDTPTGPFDYLYSKSPHGFDSRDMTVFKDDDNSAYLVYSSEDNSVVHIGPLTEDYLDVEPVMKRIMVGQHREAPAVFKHQNTYYMITSGCTGWAPNEALAHAAESIMGPWETLGNPCVGGNNVFRWNPADLRDSRYLWLPLIVGGPADRPLESSFGFPMWSRVSVYWHRQWRLPSRGGKEIA